MTRTSQVTKDSTFPSRINILAGMAKSCVPSPQEVVKVRRSNSVDHPVLEEPGLPPEGDTLQFTATVTRVDPHNADTRWDKVTVEIPGYPVPMTPNLAEIYGRSE